MYFKGSVKLKATDKKLAGCLVLLYPSHFQIALLLNTKLAIFFGLRLIPGRNSLLYCFFRIAEATMFQ